MQKIVLSDGRVIDVDIAKEEDGWFFKPLQKAVMIDDCLVMNEIWVYEFLRVDHSCHPIEYTFIDYMASKKELSKEKLVYEMIKRDLNAYDIVIPHKAFVLEAED